MMCLFFRNGYNLFCTEMMAKLTNLSSQQRIVECGKLWNQKSNEEKSHYHTRHLQLKQEYEANYKKFFEVSSSTVVCLLLQLSKVKGKG